MKKSFISDLMDRRFPQIVGTYLFMYFGLVEFLDVMIKRYDLPEVNFFLIHFCLMSILPSVITLAYFHGSPGEEEWNELEKYGDPVNVLFIVVSIFLWNNFKAEEIDNVVNNVYCIINSNQNNINQWEEWYESLGMKFEDIGAQEVQPIPDSTFEKIITQVPIKVTNKLKHLDLSIYFPEIKKNMKNSALFLIEKFIIVQIRK